MDASLSTDFTAEGRDPRRDASRTLRGLRRFTGIWRVALAAWLGFVADLPTHAAESPDAAFDAANRLFEQGKYLESVGSFEAILRSGQVSPALYYNLGNAYFRLGEVGRAIASYRLALRLAPRDPDVAANLAFARASVPGATPLRTAWWERFATRLSLNEWATLTGLALWLWMIVLVWRQRVREPGPMSQRFVRLAAASTMLLGVVLVSALVLAIAQRGVVVISNDAVLRHGPLDESPSLQTLHDGQELRVLDEKDGWLMVTGAARGQGWIKRAEVLAVR